MVRGKAGSSGARQGRREGGEDKDAQKRQAHVTAGDTAVASVRAKLVDGDVGLRHLLALERHAHWGGAVSGGDRPAPSPRRARLSLRKQLCQRCLEPPQDSLSPSHPGIH